MTESERAALRRECEELGVKFREDDLETSVAAVALMKSMRALKRLIPIVRDSGDEQLSRDFGALLDVYHRDVVLRGILAGPKEKRARIAAAVARTRRKPGRYADDLEAFAKDYGAAVDRVLGRGDKRASPASWATAAGSWAGMRRHGRRRGSRSPARASPFLGALTQRAHSFVRLDTNASLRLIIRTGDRRI
jgi:hypothetical protein